jgi:biopolymer transport protein ExbD
MPRKNLKPKQEEAAIDMTPMLDIVFIMLIFFIVTTSFVKESGAPDITKPEAAKKESQPKANIFIGISNEGDVYMLRKKVDKESVKTILTNLLTENPESEVVIQADTASNSGLLLDIMSAAKDAGVKKVSTAVEK